MVVLEGNFGLKMKFMKLGSKPDAFQADGKSVRYEVSIYVLLYYSSSSQLSSLFFPSSSVFLHFVLLLARLSFDLVFIFDTIISKKMVLQCFLVEDSRAFLLCT